MVNLRKSDTFSDYGSVVFYTVEETGESGTNQSGLARLCGVSRQAIINLEATLVTKSPSKWLESFVGKKLTLVTSEDDDILLEGKNPGNLKIYNSKFCFAVIQHYAFQQLEIAQESSLYFGEQGFNFTVQQITGWIQSQNKKTYIPYWYKRLSLFASKTRIPDGWWCVFEELTKLMSELEAYGYVIADISPVTGKRITPDISIGGMFCKYMRNKGVDIDSMLRKYKHYYPDGRVVDANIYPDDILFTFRSWFNSTWKKERLIKYLGERDPESLPSIHKLLGLPEAGDIE